MYKVILVDDEIWVIRALAKLQWERYGFHVVCTTTNSSEAEQVIREHAPDLVISDIRMGEVTGLDLLRRFAKDSTRPLFVLISAYSEFHYAHEALRHGAFDYILKPYTQNDMYRVLSRAREELDQHNREAEVQLIHLLEGRGSQSTAGMLQLPVPDSSGPLCVAAGLIRFPWTNALFTDLEAQCVEMELSSFRFGDRHFTFLLMEWREELLPQMRRIAEERMAFLGASGTFSPLQHLGPQVENARRAACRCLFYDSDSLEICSEREPQDDLLRTTYLVLSNGVRDGDCGVVCRFLDGLPQLFQSRRANISTVMEIANHIQVVFQEYAVLHGLPAFQDGAFDNAGDFLDIYGSAESLVQTYKQRAEQLFHNGDTGIEQVCRYIDSHYNKIGSVGELADQFHLDLGYLSRAYKQRTGENIKAAITRRKLDNAQEILRNTDLQINEVAALCGYGDYFYFARVFRRELGVTPTDYRNTYRASMAER